MNIEQINLVLGTGRPVLHCVKKNSAIYKNKGTSIWNFFPNSGLRKYRHRISIVERAINLARQGGRSERDELGRRRSTKLRRSTTIVHPRDRQALYRGLQHDFVARVN